MNPSHTTTPYRTLSVLTDGEPSVADRLLSVLRSAGVFVQRWTLASTERPGFARLIADIDAQNPEIEAALENMRGVHGFEVLEPNESSSMELAVVSVHASAELQDEAAAIVAATGGRLLSLTPTGFTAQISNRPDRIDSMLQCLRTTAPTEAVRSGPLAIRR